MTVMASGYPQFQAQGKRALPRRKEELTADTIRVAVDLVLEITLRKAGIEVKSAGEVRLGRNRGGNQTGCGH